MLVSAATLAPWLFSPTALIDAVASELQASTGLYVATRGRIIFALSPRPHVSIEGIAFADRNGALLIDADQLHGILDLWSLATGRLEVGAFALVRPRATIDLTRIPIEAPGIAARAAATRPATPEAQKAEKARVGVIAVVDGTLRVRREGRDYLAEKINATLDWPRTGAAATLSGDLDWRGQRLEATLWIAKPLALMRGDQSIATARLDGANLRLEAQGVAQSGAKARFSGRVAGAAGFVRDAFQLFNFSVPLPGAFGDLEFSTQGAFSASDARLDDLNVRVDGNAYEGEATLSYDDSRPRLAATLKSGFVSFKPMFTDAPALVASDGQWSHENFTAPEISGVDVDLRLDAAHARLDHLTVDDASIALTLRDGVFDLALMQSQAYRGRLKARAELRTEAAGLRLHFTAQTAGVDARALLWDAFGKQAVAGELASAVTLDSVGENMAALMRGLAGRAALTLTDGEIAGVDIDGTLRSLEKRPLTSAQGIGSGRSELESARATIAIENGVGTIKDGVARGRGFALDYSGTASFVERSLSIDAVAREADSVGKPRENGIRIDLNLSGGWDDLAFKPDAQAFIRRSDAAAPLLPRAP